MMEFPVRRAFGTFSFACMFIAHLVVVLTFLDDLDIPSLDDHHSWAVAGVYGCSFIVSLLSGLALVSSAYCRHYIKVIIHFP